MVADEHARKGRIVDPAGKVPDAPPGDERPALGLLRLRGKFVGFVSIAFVVSGLLFGWVFSRQQGDRLRAEFEKRGESIARGIAVNARLDVWAGNRERLERLVAGTLEEDDVLAVALYDTNQEVLAAGEKRPGSLPPGRLSATGGGVTVGRGRAASGEPILVFRSPIELQRSGGEAFGLPGAEPEAPRSRNVGSMQLVLGLGAVERQIAEVHWTTFRITLVIVGLGVLSVLALSTVFVTPIVRMAATARRIAAGDRSARAPVSGRDEIAELAAAFNTMTGALADREAELREMNVGLERKVRERTVELEQKQEELMAANIELERANRLKSEFLANMSHELRTPLNAVNGFSELLLEQIHGQLTPKQKRYVENILGSGRHLLQLINDILDLSKIEAGRMDVFAEEFGFAQVVENAVNVIQPLAQKKGLTVRVDVSPEVEVVRLDPGKTRQVLYNLLSNAVKFTDEGQVTVEARSVGEELEIAVSDTGIGISPEDQARIFREFEQIDGSHSRKYEGTGLGLALTRKLVEVQKGSIRVESEPGRGSRFIVRLPRWLENGSGPGEK